MESPARVSGRRLLAAVGGWVAAAAALYGLVIGAEALGARHLVRAHLNSFGAGLVCALYLLLLGALVIAFGPSGVSRQLGLRFTRVRDLVLAVPLWFATVIAAALLSAPFQRWLGAPKTNAGQLIAARHDPIAAPVLIVTLVALAPLTEELLFRGGLYGWLRGRTQAAFAAPLSALLFAAAHRFLPLLVLLFVVGLVMALYYQRTGSTLNTFVMHACQNTAAVIAVYAGMVR